MTQQELLQRMTNDEFDYWVARETFDPIPDSWFQWRYIMAALTPQKNEKYLTPERFEFKIKKKHSDGGRSVFEALANANKHKEKNG